MVAVLPTVFVVDDTPQVRRLIERLLRGPEFAVRSFASAEEFLSRYDAEQPGCLVVDVRMKGMDGLELQRELLARGIRIPVIVMSAYVEVPGVVSAIRAGAIDFLEKPFEGEQLLRAVREGIARDRERRQDEARLSSLTPRERQVLSYLVAGENTKEIASRMGVSSKTVEGHRIHLLRKLGLRSVVEAVKFILERRLS